MVTIAQSRDRPRAKPVYLVEITLKNSGPTLYFSDRNILVGSQQYENYIEDIQGIGEEIKRIDSTFLNIDITIIIKNERFKTYNHLVEIGDIYPFEGADCTIKEVCLDDDNNPSDTETLLKCNLDELEDIDLLNFSCKLSSRIFQKDLNYKQELIDTTNYPNAYEEVGKYEPIICGADILVPAIRIDWGARTTLRDTINTSQVTGIILSEFSRFPSSGALFIDEEKILYTSMSSSGELQGTVTRSAGGTEAKPHNSGAQIWEYKSQYDSLLASHECKAINDIYAVIDNHILKVISGVSAVLVSGKHYIRAVSQINTKQVENISYIANLSSTNRDPISHTSSDYVTNEQYAYDVDIDTCCDIYGTNAWLQLAFSADSLGTIYRQRFFIRYNCDDGGYYQIEGLNKSWLEGTGTGNVIWIEKVKMGGEWDDWIYFEREVDHDNVKIYDVYKTVEYYSISLTKYGGVISTNKVDYFLANVDGIKDDSSGTITGTPNALIERCDHQFKFWLVNKFGFSLANDIDTTSFNTAGSWYASNNYKFAFRIDNKITPSEFLQKLAFECRSTIKEKAGKWYLDVLPDTAPSAIKTISKSELAGEFAKFTFSKTRKSDLANDLTAKFKRDYAGMLHDSDWLGTSKTSDSTSQSRYGIYAPQFELEYIRLQAMSDSVLAHIKLQRKNILLTAKFPVLWEHFDLKEGMTFDISYPLNNGRKFYIENFRRIDKGKAEIEAVEWWS